MPPICQRLLPSQPAIYGLVRGRILCTTRLPVAGASILPSPCQPDRPPAIGKPGFSAPIHCWNSLPAASFNGQKHHFPRLAARYAGGAAGSRWLVTLPILCRRIWRRALVRRCRMQPVCNTPFATAATLTMPSPSMHAIAPWRYLRSFAKPISAAR